MKVSEILRSGVIRELQQRGVDSGPSLQLMADGVIAKMQQGVDGTLNVDGVGLGQFLDGALAGGEAGAVAGAGGQAQDADQAATGQGGDAGGQEQPKFSIEEAINNPAVAEQWFNEDPEGFGEAMKGYREGVQEGFKRP